MTTLSFCSVTTEASNGAGAASAAPWESLPSRLYFTNSGLSDGSTCVPVGNPVAMMVQVMRLPVSSLEPIPIITFAFPPASRWIWSVISPISSIVTSWSPSPEVKSKSTFFAPLMWLSFNNGESSAAPTALAARPVPSPSPVPNNAEPLFSRTVLASRKSIFWV